MPSHVMEITRIVTEAVLSAQEENRRKGVPNVYVLNGKLVWQLPDGTVLSHPPPLAKSLTTTKKILPVL